MRNLKQQMVMSTLAAVSLASYSSVTSAEILPLEGSMKFYQSPGGSAAGYWTRDNSEQVAEMKTTRDGDVIGFFILPKNSEGDRAWKISFDIASKGFTQVAGLRPYLHVYSKFDGKSKYNKNMIVPYEKLLLSPLPGDWIRVDWVCKGCLAPNEKWAKIIIVLKPTGAAIKTNDAYMLLKHLRIDNICELDGYNLKVERLNSPGDDLK